MNIDVNALREMIQDRGFTLDQAVGLVEEAMLSAYHKLEGAKKHARAELNSKTGAVHIFVRDILSEEPNPNPKDEHDTMIYELSDEYDATPEKYSRVAISQARQKLNQRLNEAEDFKVLGDFKNKKGQIVSGVVKPFEATEQSAARNSEALLASRRGLIKLDVGSNVEVSLPLHEQVTGEDYTPGNRFRVLVLDVNRGPRGPQITVSRSHPDLVRKLFALEVPEIEDGTVEIIALAREAGHRTKVSIKSNDPAVNAKGALIGPMGVRARAVMNALNGEKIDIIGYDENPAKYIANALSPSKTVGVKIIDEENKSAHVVVPDYQLSLAIGREGQNARLAARLTGWKIDITSDGKTKAPEQSEEK